MDSGEGDEEGVARPITAQRARENDLPRGALCSC